MMCWHRREASTNWTFSLYWKCYKFNFYNVILWWIELPLSFRYEERSIQFLDCNLYTYTRTASLVALFIYSVWQSGIWFHLFVYSYSWHHAKINKNIRFIYKIWVILWILKQSIPILMSWNMCSMWNAYFHYLHCMNLILSLVPVYIISVEIFPRLYLLYYELTVLILMCSAPYWRG